MGTDVVLSLVCKSEALAEYIATELFARIHQYELRFSRFLPTSELSQLNREKTTVVSKSFIEILERSLELSHLTDGAFNPLLQVVRLGYTESFDELTDKENVVDKNNYSTDLEAITIDKNSRAVTLDETQALDFGGILKGYLADQLADHVTDNHPECAGVIINIGGDLAARCLDSLHQTFIFELYNPVTGKETPVPIKDASLSTSGTYKRTWQTNDGQKNHIVDEATKSNPESKLVSASIIHSNGALTEALTKLFLVRGVAASVALVPPEIYQYKYFCVTDSGEEHTNLV